MQIMSSFNNNEPRRPDHQAENNELDLLPPGHQKTSSFPETFNHLPAKEPFELDDHPNKSNPFILPKCTSTLKYTQEMERDYRNDQFLDTICKRSKYDQSMDTIYMRSPKQFKNRGPDGAIHFSEENYPSENAMGLNNCNPTVLVQNRGSPQIPKNRFSPAKMTRTEEEVKKENDSESDGNSVSDGEDEDYKEEPKGGPKNCKTIIPEVTNDDCTKGDGWLKEDDSILRVAMRGHDPKKRKKRGFWDEKAKLFKGRITSIQCKTHWQKFQNKSFEEKKKNTNIVELKKFKKFLLEERKEINAYALKAFALHGIPKSTLDTLDNMLLNIPADYIDSKLKAVPLKEKKSNKKDKKLNKKRNIPD